MSGAAVPLDVGLAEARQRFTGFLARLPRTARLIVFCHSDADGLAAGALFGRTLPRLGFEHVRVIPSLRGESAFSDEARDRLRALDAEALIVTDLGVHQHGVLPRVPTLYVDHHRPSGEPPGAVVVSGYGWVPIPASAWLAYELLRQAAAVEDLAWLAAVGTLGDLGDNAPWPELKAIKNRVTAKWLKEAVVLINAARRASQFDIDTPLRLLMEADHPREVSEDAARGADRLHAYRKEVNAEVTKARRQPPRFSETGPYALVCLHSLCQIHPLIAQQWRGRLRDYAVIAANTGYLPNVVAFSMRTARPDLNLPRLLQALDPGDYGGRFGQGHDQASGGQIPPEAFATLLERLGFDSSAAQ